MSKIYKYNIHEEYKRRRREQQSFFNMNQNFIEDEFYDTSCENEYTNKYILCLNSFLSNKKTIDYKDFNFLKNFINTYGLIKSRKQTYIYKKFQNKISKSIRRSRICKDFKQNLY